MMIKEAIEYLRPIRDNASLSNYAYALDIAIKCMEEREAARIVGDALLAELKKYGGCDTCRHKTAPLPCIGADYICDNCPDEACVCHACEKNSRWEWRGIQEDRHGQQSH